MAFVFPSYNSSNRKIKKKGEDVILVEYQNAYKPEFEE